MLYKKLSIVVPVHNEEKTLRQIIEQITHAEFGVATEIVLVNDGSRDSSAEILADYAQLPGFKVLHNEKNMGKSQTVRKGITATTGDLVVVQDADLEYDPAELKQFVEIFQMDKADLVYGNRFGKKNKVIYWQNWIGNTLLSLFSSLLTGLRAGIWARDMEVCYKMCRGDVFREIGTGIVSTSSFGLEPEVTAKFAKYKLNGKHLRFAQVAISYKPRTFAEGKQMKAIKDGIKALWEIIKFNLLSN